MRNSFCSRAAAGLSLLAGMLCAPTLGSRLPRSAKSWSSSQDETDPDALGEGVTMGAWY